MKSFAELFEQLDQTTKTTVKVAALGEYFKSAADKDKVWTIALLSHRRPKRTVTSTQLRTWAAEASNLPSWLFEESYHTVGDLAETIALLLPINKSLKNKSLSDWITLIIDLKSLEEAEKKAIVLDAWENLDAVASTHGKVGSAKYYV